MDCGQPANSVRCLRCCNRLRNGRPWERLKARVFAEESHCWICTQWVDQDLPPEHARSRTADHVHALRDGGPALDRNNLRLAHRDCNTGRTNQARGTRTKPAALSVDPSTI
jgi:5-methylcytosine-specific restriction endonuclease McrA